MATDVETSTESRAICRYLATKYPHHGNSLLPDLSKIWTVASVELNNFDALARLLHIEILFKLCVIRPLFTIPSF